MTTIQVVKIKRKENSEWEKVLELIIEHFDAIHHIYDEYGFEIDCYYDIKEVKNFKPIDIPNFP